MKIDIEAITDYELLQKAMKHVFGVEIKAPLYRWYDSGHSPIRTQIFAIYVTDMPYSVAMQMRTHEKNGALFLVEPGRPDTGTERAKNQTGNYREQPRNVFILCNAQHLMDWSHKRLCNKAEEPTRDFFLSLKQELSKIDPALSNWLIPMCKYRNGHCGEFKSCNF